MQSLLFPVVAQKQLQDSRPYSIHRANAVKVILVFLSFAGPRSM